LIYIKDYRLLNTLVSGSPSPAAGILECLLGKAVTVFVENGCCGFTGILVEIRDGTIKLARPSCAPCRGCRSPHVRPPSECIVIARKHIAAIVFNGV
jgi:hypothetical protein